MEDDIKKPPMTRLEKQPERKHAFVPERYGTLTINSRQDFYYSQRHDGKRLACFCRIFVPEMDPKKNIESMSEEQLAFLNMRAQLLYDHAAENSLYGVSESTWESDIRSDLFGLIRTDRRIRMDKTLYQYKYTDPDTSTITIRKRYPDITFGLTTFWNGAVQHQIKERSGKTTCGKKHVDMHPASIKERIHKQLFHRACGLVVDPRWGSVDLVFPWTIFEAKKRSLSL